MIKKILALMAIAIGSATIGASAQEECCSQTEPRIGVKCIDDELMVGADDSYHYLPLLRDKRIGIYSNHTGLVWSGTHIVDRMRNQGLDIAKIFSPEHGFRGDADAGEHVASGVDPKTGIEIVSLYGPGHKAAMEAALDSIDVIVVDIQDVGLRFYTYYCTMLELMNGAIRHDLDVVILDRPNPNGMYVDGPILDMKLQSGVGRLPIPVVHGMTLGELALMANGEGWLDDGQQARVTVVPCANYTHQTRYELPVAPSPNLPNMQAIYLYPSTCLFEGTHVSLGRGTDKPFQIYGHPDMKNRDYEFTPESRPGATNPPQLGNLCHGVDLSQMPVDDIIARGFDLTYIIDAYRDLGGGDAFFTPFFEKLIGRSDIRQMIIDGKSADEIKATWADDVEAFRAQRAPYLLYPE